jgi:membrane protease YdiL (CAAX protease family)
MAQSSLQSTAQVLRAAPRAAQARRGLTIYFALLIPLSAVFEGLTIITGNAAWIYLLMCVPALASVIARLALREGFADVSFRIGGQRGWRAIGTGFILPSVIGIVAYGAAWMLGLAHFVGRTQVFGLMLPPALVFTVMVLVTSTINLLPPALTGVLAAGEEIGWRGFMLTRLIDAGVPQPILLSGVIWGLWHLPLILAGLYAAGPSPVLSAALFLIGATAFGTVIAWLRLESGSIWPAIVLHGVWNNVIQGPFDHATTGPAALLWTGESGILTVAMLMVVALLVARRVCLPLRQPRPGAPAGTDV